MEFIKGNVKLSEETWQCIQPTNQSWEAELDDEGMDEALPVNWH